MSQRFQNFSTVSGAYLIHDLKTGECLSSLDSLINKLNEYEEQLKPIREVCDKYDIPLKDLPGTLEEYIAYDNAEYLEKLKNQW